MGKGGITLDYSYQIQLDKLISEAKSQEFDLAWKKLDKYKT